MKYGVRVFIVLLAATLASGTARFEYADIILYRGKITTLDPNTPDATAIAIKKDKIIALGTDREVLAAAGKNTLKIDLHGRRVLPGLIDNHAHPLAAAQSEYQKELPVLHSIRDLFAWIKKESQVKKPGEWIVLSKFFFTRLKEKRWPSLAELDAIAPENPVFLNGSYAGMVNTKALEASEINRFSPQSVLRDKVTRKPTGHIRQAGFKHLNNGAPTPLTKDEKLDALKLLFQQYNAIGITSVCAGNGGVNDFSLLNELQKRNELNVRVFQNFSFPSDPTSHIAEIRKTLKSFPHKTGEGNEWVKVGALKVVVDGGILTGTAFMGEPWGSKAMKLYGFSDPSYRGELNLSRTQLAQVITAAAESGWKFTAHVTGSAGVDTLLAAFRDANEIAPLKEGRHSIIHGNFFSEDAISTMARLNIYADIQPIWFYKDVEMLNGILSKKRMADFHPYQKMIDAQVMLNGGSDHMVMLDPDRAINPYNPFQAMWSLITRQSENGNKSHTGKGISRENALRMYTINNAYASFEESIKGSLKTGKLADLIVISTDMLTCPVDQIKDIKPLLTMVGGKIVHSRPVDGK